MGIVPPLPPSKIIEYRCGAKFCLETWLRKKLLLYLDLNCFNRPFDDQTQDRVRHEAAAVLSVLQRIELGVDQLAWSAVLAFENAQHPLPDRRDEIARWGR
jgi:hypothetical protein